MPTKRRGTECKGGDPMDALKRVWTEISDFFLQYVWTPVKGMDWRDIADILLLAVLLYTLYRFFRTRRAGRVMLGLVAVVVCSLLVLVFKLPALTYIVRLFAASAFFCVIVIFQPEIRDAMENIGNLTVLNPGSNRLSRKKMEQARLMVNETVDAVMQMSESRTGALIVFEGLTKLGDCVQTGKPVDARVTSKLLQNIFYDKAPLHDGALIIRDMRIYAASCVLPSTKSKMDFGNMGTRHRAAVGVTEVSDALVVVVSEQTGVVSVAQNGKLLRDVDDKALCEILMTYVAGKSYFRQKRANMRRDYLKQMEELSRADEPRSTTPNQTVEREFERLFGSAGEADSTEEGAVGAKKNDTKQG